MVYYRGDTSLIIMLGVKKRKKEKMKLKIIKRFENQTVEFELCPADNWESFNILSKW